MLLKLSCWVLLCFCLMPSVEGQSTDSVYTNADRMPYFPGCSAYKVGSKERRACSNQTVKAYIFNHIVYPQSAKDANIEGAVYIRFIIDEMGYVQQPKLLKDIGGGCGKAALTVVENMPRWEPAYHQGKHVKVALDLPLHFYFKEVQNNEEMDYYLVWGKLNAPNVSRKNLRKNLEEPIAVFNKMGTKARITELHFTYQKGNKLIRKSSNGKVTPPMEKMLKKIRKGGHFSIVATVQEKGQFIEVGKEYAIAKY